LKCKDWEPADLHASVQGDIHPQQFFDDNTPFAVGRELIVNIPTDPRGYADVYIDDTTGLTVDLPGTRNADRLEAATPLALEVAARPNDVNEPIPREKMVAEDKLKAEGGLSETKTILGWLFNFCTLTVSLPEHKYIAWSNDLRQMIRSRRTTKKQLESTIGCLGHVSHHPLGVSLPELTENSPFSSREIEINQNRQNLCEGLGINAINSGQSEKGH